MNVYLQKRSRLFTKNLYVQKDLHFVHNVLQLFTKTKNSQFLLALLHPCLHFLDALVALGDCLPARTRVYLRELGWQEIVQCFKQDHLQRPPALIQAVDQVGADPGQKFSYQHLEHDPFLPPTNVQTILLVVHDITILVHKTIHRSLREGHSPVAPQKSQIQAPLCWWVDESSVQSRVLLGTIHVHVLKAVHIDGIGQVPQAPIHYSHPRVHHFEKITEQHQQNFT